MRIILYTGKGGVGKTSVAAATACRLAADGRRTLVVSTDAAHSLGDSFGVKLGNDAVKISEKLYGMEIDTAAENEKNSAGLMAYMNKLMTLKGGESVEAEELLIFPGFEELLSLVRIKELADSGEYDVIVVDCAPTGETMSLLKFPDLFRYWWEKFFPMKRKAAKAARPLIEATVKVPVPDDGTFDEIDGLFEKISTLHEMMTDSEAVSIRIVTTPEKIVVREAKRSLSYLRLFDYNVDAVIINRIFPERSLDGYFSRWGAIQAESIKDICESFSDIPIFRLELQSTELRLTEQLAKVGEALYGESDPAAVLCKCGAFTLTPCGEDKLLEISLPFAEKSELSMSQSGDELSVAVKNERRVFVLPDSLHGMTASSAKYENGTLKITFVK